MEKVSEERVKKWKEGVMVLNEHCRCGTRGVLETEREVVFYTPTFV